MIRTVIFITIALLINATAGLAAWHRGSVTGAGGFAGALVGAVILIAGGFVHWIMLMLFFVSSSIASRLGAGRKANLERMHERGSRRDPVQVIANGGVAAAAVVLQRVTGDPAWGVAAAAAFASVNADTWASEFGVLSRTAPRSIVTWKRLEPGTSGGVSLRGTVAAAAGSLLIAAWYAVATGVRGAGIEPSAWSILPIVLVSGLLGMFADSVLGATLQAQYVDPEGAATERRRNEIGANLRTRGLGVVTNDVVNFASSLSAAVLGWVAAGWLPAAG